MKAILHERLVDIIIKNDEEALKILNENKEAALLLLHTMLCCIFYLTKDSSKEEIFVELTNKFINILEKTDLDLEEIPNSMHELFSVVSYYYNETYIKGNKKEGSTTKQNKKDINQFILQD